MSATPAPSVPDVRAQFETVLSSVLSGESMTADTMERRLLRELLALGRSVCAVFLATRAAATMQQTHTDARGTQRPYHRHRARTYLSIFGPVVLQRPYVYRAGVGGVVPVDGQLSVPATACSDLVRETREDLAVERPYHKATGVLRRLLGLNVSTRMLSEHLAEDAPEVAAFYAQQVAPPAAEEGGYPGPASGRQGSAHRAPRHTEQAGAAGQRAETRRQERGDAHRPVHHCAGPAHPRGGGGELVRADGCAPRATGARRSAAQTALGDAGGQRRSPG